MQFQIKDLKKLLYSLEHHSVDEMNIISKHFQLTINKSKASTPYIRNNHSIANAEKSKNISKDIKRKNDHLDLDQHNISDNKTEAYSTIVSPMVGTFYRSPAPNEPPFIELYDLVQKKQTVCIIEAMKLMNEIEAEVNGEIVEILVQDGDIIDCGQALMRIKPINE